MRRSVRPILNIHVLFPYSSFRAASPMLKKCPERWVRVCMDDTYLRIRLTSGFLQLRSKTKMAGIH